MIQFLIHFLIQGQLQGSANQITSLSLGLEVLLAIFVASVLGSLHCVGMCGPFLALAVGANGNSRPNSSSNSTISDSPQSSVSLIPRWRLQTAYHFGRLTTYLFLGLAASAVASLLGLSLEHLNAPKWLSAGGLAGVVILSIGAWRALSSLTTVSFKKHPDLAVLNNSSQPQPSELSVSSASSQQSDQPFAQKSSGHFRYGLQRWAQTLAKVRRSIQSKSPTVNAYLWGVFSTLLPCGWLYLFVIAAIASPTVWWSFSMMTAFWLGTLPALAVVSVIYTSAGKKFHWIQHPITTSVILGLGIYLMISRTLEVPTIASTIQAGMNNSTSVQSPPVETPETLKNGSQLYSAEYLIQLRQALNSGLPHCGPWNPSLFPLPAHAN